MKNKIFIFCCILIFSIQSVAQELPVIPEDNIVLICTYTLPDSKTMDSVNKIYPIDSLLKHYVDKGIRMNPMIKQYRILNHYIGMDSYKVMVIYEIDKFSNVNRQQTKTVELLRSSFKTAEEEMRFWSCWTTIFDRHEDNLMMDWTAPVLK